MGEFTGYSCQQQSDLEVMLISVKDGGHELRSVVSDDVADGDHSSGGWH